MASTATYTAYSAHALDVLREIVAEVKADDPMAPVTVIVPTNITGTVARRHLARGLRKADDAIAGIWFTTLPRLAERLAAPDLAAQGRRPATRPITSSAIRSVLDDEPGHFGPVAHHPSTARALVHAHHALRDIDDHTLSQVAAVSTLSADVTRIHRQVTDRLATAWYDSTDLLAAATRLVTERRALVEEVGTVVVYLPQDLSRTETEFARALTEQAPTHLILGLTGNSRADNAVLDALAAVSPAPPPHPVRDEPLADRVLHASDSDDEVRCIVREVVLTLREAPAHRVAILYADRSPYARLLHEQLGETGIRVNGDGVRPVAERGPARLLLGLLQVARTGYRRDDVLRTLGEVAAHDFSGEWINVPQWERLTREAGVIDGPDWQARLQSLRTREERVLAQPDAHAARRAGAQRTIAAVGSLISFITELQTRLDSAVRADDWAGLAEQILDLLRSVLPPRQQQRMPREEQHALGVIKRTLGGLSALDDTAAPPTLEALEEILDQELEQSLPRVGRFGEGVYVGHLNQAIGLDLDAMYVVGLAEDLCPGPLHEDSLLPERVRQASEGQLPSTRQRAETMHRGLLAAFAAAPTVVASFLRGDLRRHTHRIPSRWLLPTLRQLTADPHLPATEWERGASRAADNVDGSPSFAAGLLGGVPSSEQEWRVRATAAGYGPDDPVVTAAAQMQEGRASAGFTRFDGNLAGQEGLPDFRVTDRMLSPTALQDYATCPHAYFVSSVLRVRPVEDPDQVIDISAMDLGNFVHRSMDRLVSECVASADLPGYGAPWSARHHERLQQIADEIAAELEEEGRTGHPLLWARKRTQVLGWLEWMLQDDDTWRAEQDARVVASELAFGQDGADPVTLDLGDGSTVALRGAADKVDQRRDGTLLVTDIKTGSQRTYRGLSEQDPVLGGQRLQLPVYALAARAAHGSADASVEALYWFTGKDRGRVPLALTASVQQRYADTVRLLVGSMAAGAFPQRAPEQPDFRWVRCAYCNPDGIGHAEVRERWEAQRLVSELRDYTGLVEPDALPAQGETS